MRTFSNRTRDNPPEGADLAATVRKPTFVGERSG
jgi:hypothetical protein